MSRPMVFEGAWSATENYAEGDVVTFNSSSYVSLSADNLNFEPDTNGLKWAVLAQGLVGPQGPPGASVQTHVQTNVLLNFVVPSTGNGSGAGAGWGVGPVSLLQEQESASAGSLPGAVGTVGIGDPLDTNPYTKLFISLSESAPFDIAVGTSFGGFSAVLSAGQTSAVIPALNGSITFTANEFGETYMILSWNQTQTAQFVIPIVMWSLQ
jgi:hypothetical protein